MSRISLESAEKQLQQQDAELWQAYDGADPPSELFHYCSAPGLFGILSSKVFFASDVLSLNDSSEIVHGRDMACELLKRDSTPLALALWDGFQLGRGLAGLGETWFAHVVCFCQTRDVLSQWRGYSGKGGFAIGLDFAKMRERAERSEFALLRMLYDRDEQHKILSRTLENFKEVFGQYGPESPKEANAVLPKMAMILLGSMVRFKHPAFHEENEWRILMIEPMESAVTKTCFLVREADVVPYTVLKFDPKLVTTVLHGPGLSSGINDISIPRFVNFLEFAHTKVEKSEIPLR